jgi:hypothetical protein
VNSSGSSARRRTYSTVRFKATRFVPAICPEPVLTNRHVFHIFIHTSSEKRTRLVVAVLARTVLQAKRSQSLAMTARPPTAGAQCPTTMSLCRTFSRKLTPSPSARQRRSAR